MKPSDDLHRLIRAMDKTERGYFKKYAQAYGPAESKNYLMLFDAIERMEEYDEEAILRTFAGEPFIKQLSVAKNYLFDLILKSLRAYKAQSSKYMRIHALMENGEILYDKGLYKQALKTWEKAEKMAATLDEKAYQLDIILWQRRYYQDLTSSEWDEKILETFERSEKLTGDYGRMIAYQRRYFKIFSFMRRMGTIRTEEQAAEWKTFMEDPLMAKGSEPEDFNGRLMYHYIWYFYYYINMQWDNGLEHIRTILKLWDANPEIKESTPLYYLAAINNYSLITLSSRKFDAFFDLTDDLHLPIMRSISTQAVFCEHLWIINFNRYLIISDFDNLGKHIAEQAEDVKKYSPYFNKVRKLMIDFGTAEFHFIIGEYALAMQELAEVLDAKDIDLRRDVQAFARILYLLIHYEMKNVLHLEHAVRSVKRYLQTREFYFTFESVFVKYFLQLIDAADKHAEKNILVKLKADLEEVMEQNPREKDLLDQLNILHWAEAKLEGISFREHLERNPLYLKEERAE
ncbi:MAG: hypothetical protein R2794_08360 [Chitinophagales bacterium]